LAWLSTASISTLAFDEVRPDLVGNWVNLSTNDFDELLPIGSKEAKHAKRARDERAVFRLFTLGVVTNRDDWVYATTPTEVRARARHLIDHYNHERGKTKDGTGATDTAIKWTRAVKRDLANNVPYRFDEGVVVEASYRPFVRRWLYSSRKLNEMVYRTPAIFGDGSLHCRCIVVSDPTAQKPWMVMAVDRIPDLHFVGAAAGALCFSPSTLDQAGNRIDNITDWSLAQFKKHYQPGSGKKSKPITKEAIFHYVYAVLHDPLYRERYAQNLKREFPRIPLYGDSEATFWQ
jgi:predicted helicase